MHLTPEEAAKQSPDFLIDDLTKRIARKPMKPDAVGEASLRKLADGPSSD